MWPNRPPSSSATASTSRQVAPPTWAHTPLRQPGPPGPVAITHTRSPPLAWATPHSDVEPGSARVAHPGPIGRVTALLGAVRTAPALDTTGAGGALLVVADDTAVVAGAGLVLTGCRFTVVAVASTSDAVVSAGCVVSALATPAGRPPCRPPPDTSTTASRTASAPAADAKVISTLRWRASTTR